MGDFDGKTVTIRKWCVGLACDGHGYTDVVMARDAEWLNS